MRIEFAVIREDHTWEEQTLEVPHAIVFRQAEDLRVTTFAPDTDTFTNEAIMWAAREQIETWANEHCTDRHVVAHVMWSVPAVEQEE